MFPCLSPTIFLSFYILPSVHLSPIQPSVHPSSHRPVTWSQVIGLRQFGLQLSLHMIPKNPAGHSIRREQFYFQKPELFLIKVESTKNILWNVCIFVNCVIVHIKINIFSMYAWRHCKYCFKKKHNPLTFIAYRPGPSWCTPIRATSVNVIARTVSITVPTCEFAFLPISPICTSWKKHAAVISYI